MKMAELPLLKVYPFSFIKRDWCSVPDKDKDTFYNIYIAPDKKGRVGYFRDDFPFYSFNPIALRKAKIAYNFGLWECSRVKTYFATNCYNRLAKTVLMKGHNLSFHWEIWKIIFELSSILPFIWSSDLWWNLYWFLQAYLWCVYMENVLTELYGWVLMISCQIVSIHFHVVAPFWTFSVKKC